MSRFVPDLRQAFRGLVRAPGFSTVAILTLALGIGANVAIFSVVRGVLLKPLAFRDADRVVQIVVDTPEGHDTSHSAADFLDLQRMSQSFEAIAGYREDLVALSAKPGEPSQVSGVYVTAGFFDVLGVPAAAGRTFGGAKPGERLFVISDETWRTEFGSDPAAIGRSVRLNGQPYLLVGVMPPRVRWPESAGLWMLSPKPVPPSPIDHGDDPTTRDVQYFSAIARVRPAVSLAAAQSETVSIGDTLRRNYPGANRGRVLHLVPVRDELVGDVRVGLVVLQAVVAVVLLIACANVSGLLVARASGRRRELAIRAALGARRGDLMLQLLSESLVLGAAGGGVGLLAGGWLVRLLPRVMPEGLPRTDAIELDWLVVSVSITAALAMSVLFGILPAWQASRANAAIAMKEAGERGSAGRSFGRSALVVVEVALTLVLLASAGLLTRSFLRLERVESGFRPEHVVVAEMVLPSTRYPDGARQIALYNRLLESLSQRAELESAGLGFPGPLKANNASGTLVIEGWPASPKDRPFSHISSVSGGFFQAMGIPLTAGRTFTERDRADAPGVAILNATLARRYWRGENVIGKRLKFDNDPKSPWSTVVGVVADTRQLGLREDPPPIVYIPYEQFALPFTNLVVRSSAPEPTVTALLRTSLSTIDRDLPFAEISTLQDVLDRSMDEPRFQTMFVGLFALVALALAAVGLYGLISFTVLQRTREIGIRIALGARPGQVLWPVIREGSLLAVIGIGAGLAGALAVTRLLGTFLFGVGATDPVTFASVAGLLLGVALVATYIPSRRAARVDPLAALRE
jgi:putative ABC transport system permease protein